MCCGVMWCGLVSCALASCHVVWCFVVCRAALRSAVVCDWLWCVVLCGVGSVLWSHDVRCGVLCFHVVWLVWFVEWCVGCLADLVVWPLMVICWLFSRLGHAVWCLHRVVCAVVCCCDVMCVGTHVITAIPREGGGGGLKSSDYFCSSGVLGNCSSGVLGAQLISGNRGNPPPLHYARAPLAQGTPAGPPLVCHRQPLRDG